MPEIEYIVFVTAGRVTLMFTALAALANDVPMNSRPPDRASAAKSRNEPLRMKRTPFLQENGQVDKRH